MNIKRSTLSVLNGMGDTKFTWDPNDPADCERMRATVADLKASGYVFFLADNRPADEVEAGQGNLIVRKLTTDEIVPEAPVESTAESPEQPRRRGRKPGVPNQNVVAVRPVRGG